MEYIGAFVKLLQQFIQKPATHWDDGCGLPSALSQYLFQFVAPALRGKHVPLSHADVCR